MRRDRSVRAAIRFNGIIVVGVTVGLTLFVLIATQLMRSEAKQVTHFDSEVAQLAEIEQLVESSVRLCTEGLAFKSDSVLEQILRKCDELQVTFEKFMATVSSRNLDGELGASAAMLPEFPPLVSAIRSGMIVFTSYLEESEFDEASRYYRERLTYLINRVSYFVRDLRSAVSSARKSARDRAEFINSMVMGVSALSALALAYIVILTGSTLSRLVLSPIKSIQEAVARIQPGHVRGKLSRPNVIEFQLLAERFNEMGERLQANERELHGKAKILEEQKVELEWANQSKSEFLAVASHELKTPVTNVRSFAEILADFSEGESLETRQEFVDIIHSEAIRLSRLVDNLLDLARIDSGAMPFEPERLDLRSLVYESVEAVRTVAMEKNLRLCVEAIDGEVIYCGDKDSLLRVLINLIGNAIKFSPEGSEISIGLERVDGGFGISVADSGPGVPDPLDKVRIFERFVQSGGHLTDRPQGTGLGLAICREIVELHAGKIECQDNEGGGARFIVSLPDVAVPSTEPDVTPSLESTT